MSAPAMHDAPVPVRLPRTDWIALALVRKGLAAAYERIRLPGSPELALDGSLLRPLLALAGAMSIGGADDDVWLAALAVQLAHEASLVHDDVIDAAATRRGQPTIAARDGTARALVEGDHLLTTAYCAAAATRSPAFVSHFARAVERTVAAERRQGALLGTRVDPTEATRIAEGKSGELTACALAAAALVRDRPDARAHVALGRELGVVYQMLDDALDYCAASDHGKPALGDFRQRRWTWPLDLVPGGSFDVGEHDLIARLHSPIAAEGGATPLERMRAILEDRIDALARRTAHVLPGDGTIALLLDEWRARLAGSCDTERAARGVTIRAALDRRLAHTSVPDHLARHARSFHFASRLLPRDARARIARVYAFCRVMDDLVDEPPSDDVTPAELLDVWMRLAQDAYDGTPSGLDVIDVAMREMAEADVPFDYVAALADGMRMDLRGARYETMIELRAYAHCVAGVVGLWIARLAGVRDGRALEHAARMGEAMQLSNIIRDVGEDHARGRLYLPADVLARHGLAPADVGSIVAGIRPVDGAYRAVLEEIMGIAEADYEAAFAWIPALPRELRACIAVAARVYAGIHDAVRERDYAPRIRARTTMNRKLALAARALLDLRGLERIDRHLEIAGTTAPEASHG